MLDRDFITKDQDADLEAKLDRYKREVGTDASNISEQRDQSNKDMRFTNVPGGQWEGEWANFFGDNRSKPEFDIVSDAKNRFVGRQIQNNIGVQYMPDDDKTSEDDAKLLNGIFRADFTQSSGASATTQAIDEMATCGVGAMRLSTYFEDDEDEDNDDQRIKWDFIVNAYNTVVWDSAAIRLDKRDALHCTVLTLYTKESFEVFFPGEEPTSAYTPVNRAEFNFPTGSSAQIYIASRYQVMRKKRLQFRYFNEQTGEIERYWKDDHDTLKAVLKASPVHRLIGKKRIIRQWIEKSIFSGSKFLEEPTRIPGKHIPIIPFYGYWGYTDGEERFYGLIRKMMDRQRIYNSLAGQLAENAFSGSEVTPIFIEGQLDGGLDVDWANRKNKSALFTKLVTVNGEEVAGPIAWTSPSTLNPDSAALLEIIPTQVRELNGGPVAEALDKNASGKAIKAAIKRQDENTLVLSQHISESIQWSGDVYMSIASEVYGGARSVRVLSDDGAPGTKRLMERVFNEESEEFEERNKLDGKKFSARADVGPAYESLREEAIEDIKGLIELLIPLEGSGSYVMALIDELIQLSPALGLDSLKEQIRKKMLIEGTRKPETEEDEQIIAEAQEQQNQADQNNPQDELMRAATAQQQAEARNLDASSTQKIADADLKGAQKIKTLSEIETDRLKALTDQRNSEIKSLNETRKRIFEETQKLPFNGR